MKQARWEIVLASLVVAGAILYATGGEEPLPWYEVHVDGGTVIRVDKRTGATDVMTIGEGGAGRWVRVREPG